jgi:hypothetical protein
MNAAAPESDASEHKLDPSGLSTNFEALQAATKENNS